MGTKGQVPSPGAWILLVPGLASLGGHSCPGQGGSPRVWTATARGRSGCPGEGGGPCTFQSLWNPSSLLELEAASSVVWEASVAFLSVSLSNPLLLAPQTLGSRYQISLALGVRKTRVQLADSIATSAWPRASFSIRAEVVPNTGLPATPVTSQHFLHGGGGVGVAGGSVDHQCGSGMGRSQRALKEEFLSEQH